MTTLITRLFANEGTASEASAALQSNGFHEDSMRTISGSGDAARSAMTEAGIDDEVASAYASKMSGGNALMALRAPFGTAGRAITALKKFETIDVGLEEEDNYVGYSSDPEYDVSVIRGGKKYLTGKGVTEPRTYFMSFGLPMLSTNQKGKAKVTTSTFFSMPTIKPPKPGKRVMSDNPTPFSNMFGLATIKKPRERKTVMTDNPTPFSSAMGWPTLTQRY